VNTFVASRDGLEDTVTLAASALVPLIAAATFALWLLARPYASIRWKMATASALAAATVAMLADQVIGHLWTRPRPFMAHAGAVDLLTAPNPDPSFPSDHAAVAFAIAVAVLFVSRRVGLLFLTAAAAIAASRVALGVHYPSDVIAGALVGAGSAWFVARTGALWLAPLVRVAGRITDPLLAPVWRARSRF
jgi:undecaprenyl-diphosphatase